MRRDPLRGLSLPAKTFVVCVMIVMIVVLGLAVICTFLLDLGPVTDFLRMLAVIGFAAFMAWGQLWLAGAAKEAAEWGGGPLQRAMDSTRAAILRQRRNRQPDPFNEGQ